MKDMNDVISYLNNVLGPHHDLTIAARNNLQPTQSNKEQIEYTDAEQIVMWCLSGLIFTLDDEIEPMSWTTDSIIEQTKNHVQSMGFDEVVDELGLDYDYPPESTEQEELYKEFLMVLDESNRDRFNRLVKTIEHDLAGDALAFYFS